MTFLKTLEETWECDSESFLLYHFKTASLLLQGCIMRRFFTITHIFQSYFMTYRKISVNILFFLIAIIINSLHVKFKPKIQTTWKDRTFKTYFSSFSYNFSFLGLFFKKKSTLSILLNNNTHTKTENKSKLWSEHAL